MKTTDQIVKFIEERIGHIYFRPRMYGGNAEGTDTLLYYYHELWAEIYDRREEFGKIKRNLEKEQKCGSANFSTRYKINNPDFSDESVADYVIEQWKRISEELNIQIPYDKLLQSLKRKNHEYH